MSDTVAFVHPYGRMDGMATPDAPQRSTRSTWQFGAIRAALEAKDSFVSAQSLHRSLHDEGSTIGLATVYRGLNKLAEAGEADLLHLDGESLYRACSHAHHHHLICRECGATVEVRADAVETWAKQVAAEHGYADPSHRVDVFGVCPACQAKRNASR